MRHRFRSTSTQVWRHELMTGLAWFLVQAIHSIRHSDLTTLGALYTAPAFKNILIFMIQLEQNLIVIKCHSQATVYYIWFQIKLWITSAILLAFFKFNLLSLYNIYIYMYKISSFRVWYFLYEVLLSRGKVLYDVWKQSFHTGLGQSLTMFWIVTVWAR